MTLCMGSPLCADQTPIAIDSLFEDWNRVPLAYQDVVGDAGRSGIDLHRLWVANDDRFLFLRFETGSEIDLSENNSLRLYLDTDADAGTGLAGGGIGSELTFTFGIRVGTLWLADASVSVYQEDIFLRSGPTVTSNVFEVAIGLDSLPDGVHPLFTQPTIRMRLRDMETGGDILPALGEIITYELSKTPLPPEPPTPLLRNDPTDLRLITYNVRTDSPWNPAQADRFGRQLAALAPDILNFQEIYGHSAADAAAFVSSWVDPGDRSWSAAQAADCITVSRFPLLGSWALDGNLATLIDTRGPLATPLLVVNAHLPCCAAEAARQAEIDRILGFLRDVRQGIGPREIAPQTPFIITGDLNLVGLVQQLHSLLTGDIVDEIQFGPDFTPDGDGTDLANLISLQTEKRMAYTWRNDFDTFWPGHLDYVISTDSALTAQNHFVLYTPEMSKDALAEAGLLADDSTASDHLLVCSDFRTAAAPTDLNEDGVVNGLDLALLLGQWTGAATYPLCPPTIAADLDGDCRVNGIDLALLLAAWG